MLFIAAFETSMLLTRQVMLERALDQSVRHLRLTTGLSVTHDAIRENLCENTVVLNNCDRVPGARPAPDRQDSYVLPDYHTMCLSEDGEVHPANRFNPGGQNELMLIRACARVNRILPISGLGLQLTRDDAGAIHVTAATMSS